MSAVRILLADPMRPDFASTARELFSAAGWEVLIPPDPDEAFLVAM